MKKVILFLFAFMAASMLLLSVPAKNSGKLLTNPQADFDVQRNNVSNFEFYSTNNGIFGLQKIATSYWPRGSQNQYLFGAGFWFGAVKFIPDSNGYRKLTEIAYNPNSGNSWMVPGLIEDGDTMLTGDFQKYKCYFSTDYDKTTGTMLNSKTGPNWPLWINDSLFRYEYGTIRNEFVRDQSKRNTTDYPLGPLFVSDEDIVSVFKDTDLRYYEGGFDIRKGEGFPLKMQYESRIYSWGTGSMKDVVFISYSMKNKSTDTLFNCWFAPVYDVDIAQIKDAVAGATNDRLNYFTDDSTQNLAYGWTNTDRGELGKGFGYIGASFIESPAVDGNGYLRNDKFIFEQSEQLGLRTFRNWDIANDVLGTEAQYNFISSNIKDGDKGPGDVRMMIATGPFNMLPGDVARVVVAIVFALPAKGGEADGTYEDMTGLKRSAEKNGKIGLLANENSLIGKLNQSRTNYYTALAMGVNNSIETTSGISVFPNPASNSANISFNLSESGITRLSVVNQLGREISTIQNGWLEAGVHNLQFRLAQNVYPEGVYFLKLQSGSSVQTKKIVIIK